MVDLLYGGVLGIAAGLAFNRVAVFQVTKRVNAKLKRDTDSGKLSEAELATARQTADRQKERIGNIILAVVWALISGLLCAVVFSQQTDTVTRLEYMAYISIGASIGAVDLDIRKIPNLSVLAMLVIRTAAVIYDMVANKTPAKQTLIPSLIGLAIAFVLFQLPTLFRIPIGVGDVKFAAAIGYCLGIFGFLQAVIVMTVGLTVLLVYLTVTKKGDRRTPVPMGPFLAAGSILAIIFPWFNEVSANFFSNLFAGK